MSLTKKPKPSSKAARLTRGRKAWEKVSAVEGVALSKEAQEMFEEFDRLGLPRVERRERIIKKYTRPK